jgi:hypothetical protein
MFNSYNIRLEVDKEGGFINSFPFKQRWLRGEEYGFLCRHYYAYSNFVKMRDFRAPFPVKHQNHPEEIYNNPNCKSHRFSNFCRRRFLLHQEFASAVLRISEAHPRARKRTDPGVASAAVVETEEVQVEEDQLQNLPAEAQPSGHLRDRQHQKREAAPVHDARRVTRSRIRPNLHLERPRSIPPRKQHQAHRTRRKRRPKYPRANSFLPHT